MKPLLLPERSSDDWTDGWCDPNDPAPAGAELALCDCDTETGCDSLEHVQTLRLEICVIGLLIRAHREHGSRPQSGPGDISLQA